MNNTAYPTIEELQIAGLKIVVLAIVALAIAYGPDALHSTKSYFAEREEARACEAVLERHEITKYHAGEFTIAEISTGFCYYARSESGGAKVFEYTRGERPDLPFVTVVH